LNLTFAPDTNVLAHLGEKYRLFNWSGVTPSGAFNVTSPLSWDTSKLYSDGEATLVYAPNLADTRWTGGVSGNWNNPGNWTAGVPTAGAIIEFGAASPVRQPILQNIANALPLKGIMFAPGAGTHYLGGPALKLAGDSPVVACTSASDQYLGNPLELASNTIFNVTGDGVLTASGEISGDGGLTKKGRGTLLLANRETYMGTTRIEEGTLAFDTTGDLENSPIINNGTLLILGGDHTVGSIVGEGHSEFPNWLEISFPNSNYGTVVVLGGTLTATSIVQDTLIIGGNPASRLRSRSVPAVPEPTTASLLIVGLACCAALAHARRRTGVSRRRRTRR
jgi:autotransporter-associated beta strand protein